MTRRWTVEAERVLGEIDAAGSLGDYAWGIAVIQKDDAWRRGTKHGPENTVFAYADGSSVWWSPDRLTWLAGR